jgi:hypothetical protein
MAVGPFLRKLFVKVGSLYPLRQDFRLTPELDEKFTEKLGHSPRDSFVTS